MLARGTESIETCLNNAEPCVLWVCVCRGRNRLGPNATDLAIRWRLTRGSSLHGSAVSSIWKWQYRKYPQMYTRGGIAGTVQTLTWQVITTVEATDLTSTELRRTQGEGFVYTQTVH